jgi:hypothetical protein
LNAKLFVNEDEKPRVADKATDFEKPPELRKVSDSLNCLLLEKPAFDLVKSEETENLFVELND